MFYLDLSNYFSNFASKFTKYIWIMQEKRLEFTSLGPLAYYGKLTVKEKVMLKSFVAHLFHLSYYTVDAKFRGKTNFSAAELLALQPIIESESWKQ